MGRHTAKGCARAGAAPPLQDLAPGCRTMRHATALAGAWRGYATNYPMHPGWRDMLPEGVLQRRLQRVLRGSRLRRTSLPGIN